MKIAKIFSTLLKSAAKKPSETFKQISPFPAEIKFQQQSQAKSVLMSPCDSRYHYDF